jgi:hypothetical protein
VRAALVGLALAACAGPSAPRNRAGVVATPFAAGVEAERFLDGDADHGSWSAGLTLGVVWEGVDALLERPRDRDATVVALNPLVRWHAYRPTDWLTLALDGKVSLVWFLPEGDLTRAAFALAIESHASAAADDRWVYGLVGAGVKQFLFRTGVAGTRFPRSLTMPAGELSFGLRW